MKTIEKIKLFIVEIYDDIQLHLTMVSKFGKRHVIPIVQNYS